MWRLKREILTLGRLKQEDCCKFKARLTHRVRPYKFVSLFVKNKLMCMGVLPARVSLPRCVTGEVRWGHGSPSTGLIYSSESQLGAGNPPRSLASTDSALNCWTISPATCIIIFLKKQNQGLWEICEIWPWGNSNNKSDVAEDKPELWVW